MHAQNIICPLGQGQRTHVINAYYLWTRCSLWIRTEEMWALWHVPGERLGGAGWPSVAKSALTHFTPAFLSFSPPRLLLRSILEERHKQNLQTRLYLFPLVIYSRLGPSTSVHEATQPPVPRRVSSRFFTVHYLKGNAPECLRTICKCVIMLACLQ